jgi:hypothetical protein
MFQNADLWRAPGREVDWWKIFMLHLTPFFLGVSLVLLAATSNVANVVLFEGAAARVAIYSYGAILLLLTLRPFSIAAHKLGGLLAMLVFCGRAVGLFEFILEGSTHLWGAAAQNFAMGYMAMVWHVGRIRGIAREGARRAEL